MTDAVTLQLHDADSIRVLRAALASAQRIHAASAEYHDATGRIRRGAGDAAEANRHKRQAAVYLHRAALAQQLVDQLPAEPTKEPAP